MFALCNTCIITLRRYIKQLIFTLSKYISSKFSLSFFVFFVWNCPNVIVSNESLTHSVKHLVFHTTYLISYISSWIMEKKKTRRFDQQQKLFLFNRFEGRTKKKNQKRNSKSSLFSAKGSTNRRQHAFNQSRPVWPTINPALPGLTRARYFYFADPPPRFAR